jgi:DtxR family transcriptional regulator, Mn-dependent transcriptional regulator
MEAIHPLTALVVGLVMLVAVGLVFWPHGGLLDRWRASRRVTLRVRSEDALKHAYDCEYRRLTCSLESIAGALDVSTDMAADIVARLEQRHLLRSSAGALTLTGDGRSYALRVIRVHRLWEHLLADESGLQETEWHEAAEQHEHSLSPEEADALAARLGNPAFDPHGDPIPSSTGAIPRRPGMPLTDLPAGRLGRVIHVEDEPKTVYAQLVALGLHPGTQVRMVESLSDRVRFTADEEEAVLAPLLARNITVQQIGSEERIPGPHRTLAGVRRGEPAVVVGIARSCRGQQRRRLMDLGVVPGTTVIPEMVSVGGDPVAYRLRGSLIALRRTQAQQIYVSREGTS